MYNISFIRIKRRKLISSSGDNSLNIFKKNSYELQISNKEYSNYISSYTQIKDGKIITSNILKLKENEFVTSSIGDKCLEFWNINNY